MSSELYQWVAISRGQPLLAGAVMSGRTSSDGDVYVGRNGAGEVGKVNLHEGKMHNIWCHAGGAHEHCELLVLRGGTVQWRPFKSGEKPPDGAVWAGVTKTDGRHGVFVGRDKQGAGGKINLTDDTGALNNLWIHGYWNACKEGEILVVNSTGSYAGGGASAVPFPGGWNANAPCEGLRAEERALYLQQHDGLSVDAARQKVMSEFPTQFARGAAWNPAAMCDGVRAEERALYLQNNQHMTVDAARNQVMQEFPAQFGGATPAGKGGGGYAAGGWNPSVNCDGSTAEERATWLQQNKGMTMEAARNQIMHDFPSQFGKGAGKGKGVVGAIVGGIAAAFGVGPMWNPNAVCDGSRAEERAKWLHDNKGLTVEAARQQIMREFPGQFGGAAAATGPTWKPNAICDGKRAEERATWLQENKHMTPDAARRQVMQEFPTAFQ